MKLLGDAPAPRAERPASVLLHDEPNVRIVSFSLLPGQTVPPHSSASTVIVEVVSGTGLFRGENRELELTAGQAAVFAPAEVHAIAALNGPLNFLALITPRPG